MIREQDQLNEEALESAFKNIEIFKMMLESSKINIREHNYVIDWAAASGNSALLKYLLFLGMDPSTNKCIVEAAKGGNVEVVEILLSDGRANPLAWNNAALDIACKDFRVNMIEAFMKDPRVISNLPACYQVLQWACEGGTLSLVEQVIKNSTVDINKPLTSGNISLHLAAVKDHVEVMAALLRAGADKFAKNDWDITPIDIANTRKNRCIGLFEPFIWTPKTHSQLPPYFKKQIKCLMMLAYKQPTTGQPKYPNQHLYKLPKDMLFYLFTTITTWWY